MTELLVLPVRLGSDEVGKNSTVASTDDTVDMNSMPTVDVIETSLVYRRRKGVVCRQTLALEYRLP